MRYLVGKNVRIVLLAFLVTPVACAQSATASSSFARAFVAAHNQVRSGVGVAPLRWSDQLADSAQQWANALIESGAFHPRGDHRFGENLFEVTGRGATPAEVVYAWAGEARNYDRRTNTCSARCGHYTQVVWRDTELVGCGTARDNRREVWVCTYDPLGNISGERPY